MALNPRFLTQMPNTPIGKEAFALFFPKRYKLLKEGHMGIFLAEYAAKVGKWKAEEGKKIDRPEYYDETPFGADKQLYTCLRLWYATVKPKGTVTYGEFLDYVSEAAKDGKTRHYFSVPTDVSRPLRLLLKCAWNLADDRKAREPEVRAGESKVLVAVPKLEGRKASVVFTYVGTISPYNDGNLRAFRPSAMKMIEQFAEYLGGKQALKAQAFSTG